MHKKTILGGVQRPKQLVIDDGEQSKTTRFSGTFKNFIFKYIVIYPKTEFISP